MGDIAIMAERYEFAEFSQPYLESGLAMVVPVKPDRTKELWIFMKAFNVKMWALLAGMGIFIGFVVWLIEYESNNPDFEGSFSHQVGTILWLSFTVLSLAQSKFQADSSSTEIAINPSSNHFCHVFPCS